MSKSLQCGHRSSFRSHEALRCFVNEKSLSLLKNIDHHTVKMFNVIVANLLHRDRVYTLNRKNKCVIAVKMKLKQLYRYRISGNVSIGLKPNSTILVYIGRFEAPRSAILNYSPPQFSPTS